ncbi:hypothetical protein ACFE04_008165 [Oxalis oulophora]
MYIFYVGFQDVKVEEEQLQPRKAELRWKGHYKFLIDGEWRHDDHQPYTTTAELRIVNNVYFMDTQIWYSVFCAIFGGLYGILHHLGEAIVPRDGSEKNASPTVSLFCSKYFTVTTGQPSTITDDADAVMLMGSTQDTDSQINQKEVHWGLLEESLEDRLDKAGGLLSDSEKTDGENKEVEIEEPKVHVLKFIILDTAPARYHDSYSKLRSWTYNSLDLYKHELLRVLYPVFVHCFMDLVDNEHVQHDHEMMHLRDLQRLEGILSPAHLKEDEFAQSLRQSKLNVKMCQYSYELLLQYLHKTKSTTILGLINEHINFQEQMEEIISIFPPVFDGSLRAWCSRSFPDALVDVSRRETVRYMDNSFTFIIVRSTSFVHPLLSSCFEFILMKLGYKPSTVDSNDNLIRPFVSMYFGAAYITCPSLDKRFWSTLRSRVDSLIEDRNKSESVQVDVRVETEMNKLLKEDSTLLLRGFDSVAQTLSLLSNNIDNALQGARDLLNHLR